MSPYLGQYLLPAPHPAGHTALIPCIATHNGEIRNASRQCLGNGSWDTLTDYTECSQLVLEDSSNISLLIYAVGYILSFLALFLSLVVFLSFRELKCLRHKIHVGLFFCVLSCLLSTGYS
eukprot:TRINITY_DN35755_c0_g1_i1.p1 TRINITY_DN35755_c0_g1~~TRINITY_DN35755_c0_g1_i1.p1  ORF type:complete len:120 (+),score=13.48 TRINITY_DN35755_c0_g1_i1:168-527(+)